VIGPPCKPESVGPDSNAGEEMALREPFEIVWFNFFNAALINLPLVLSIQP
jgi:hypothetical protein